MLQSAALAIVDEQGLGALTMRALAQALQTGPMTLYNYVEDREALDVLVVEAVAAEVKWSPLAGATWQDELLHVAHAMWKTVRRHPNAIPLVLIRRTRSPGALDAAEALLSPLRRAGLTSTGLLIAFRAVSALIFGMAQGELAGPLATKAGESAGETLERVKGLPADRFPCLTEIAQAAGTTTPETEFQESLGLLIRGIEINAKSRTRR